MTRSPKILEKLTLSEFFFYTGLHRQKKWDCKIYIKKNWPTRIKNTRFYFIKSHIPHLIIIKICRPNYIKKNALLNGKFFNILNSCSLLSSWSKWMIQPPTYLGKLALLENIFKNSSLFKEKKKLISSGRN